MRISINGGHFPGEDSGAVSPLGLQEADVTKTIADIVVEQLKAEGHNALFVSKNELWEITQLSNDFGADLFVSIHCNSVTNADARGTETFAYSAGGEGERLAQCIQKQIVDSVGTIDRGVKFANFQVLRDTNCPAVLVETAFLSNKDDELLLTDEMTVMLFGRAIARGITDYVAG